MDGIRVILQLDKTFMETMNNINLITCLEFMVIGIIAHITLSLIFYGKPFVSFKHPFKNTIKKVVATCVSLGILYVLFFQFGISGVVLDLLFSSAFCLVRGFVEKKNNEPKDVYKHSFMGSLYFVIVFAASVLIFK